MVDWRTIIKNKIFMTSRIGFQREVDRLIAKRSLDSSAGGIIFIGSSIFRLWKTLEADMSPLPVINQAFGGSKTWEVLSYADRLVLPYQPKIVVYYCGSNDINLGRNARQIKDNFQRFVEHLIAAMPQIKIFFISINLAPQKQNKWHIVDSTNKLIEQYCQETANLEYIDVNSVLFDSTKKPRVECFESDRVHLKPLAYQEFSKIIKPVLENAWNAN